MHGRLVDAWKYSWADIWLKLQEEVAAPADLFMQLYPELAKALKTFPERADFDTVSNDPELARVFFQSPIEFRNDRALAHFFEEAGFIIDEIGVPELSEAYAQLLSNFLERYNLRFRFTDRYELQPHAPGIFAYMFSEIIEGHGKNQHAAALLAEFNYSLATLGRSQKSADLKSLIHKACNHLEGIAKSLPGVRSTTLGDICNELRIWPHSAVKNALNNLYGFCSDYPGIRHAGNPAGQHRELELRDSVLIAFLLLTFSGYFMRNLDFDEIVGTRENQGQR